MPAEDSFPAVAQSMRLRLRPQLSHHVTATGTVTLRPGVLPGLQIQALGTAMRLRPLPQSLSYPATTTGTDMPRPRVLPGRQIRALGTAMRLRPLPQSLSHPATTTGTDMPRPRVLPGRQIRALVTEVGGTATTAIADASIQAVPKTRLKIVST